MRKKPQPQAGDIWRHYTNTFLLIEKDSYLKDCWNVYDIKKKSKHAISEASILRDFTKLT